MRRKKTNLRYLYTFLIAIVSMLFISCSEPTMEEDAQRAADLTTMSNQFSKDNDFKEAGRTYAEVQEIMMKYKKMEKFDEFYMIYISYLQDASYNFEDGTITVPE